jgi:TrmH family RNA methyltransferase
MKAVSSRDNPLYRSLLKLGASARERRNAGLTLLDGEHLIAAWRDAGCGPVEVLAASESALEHDALRSLVDSTPARTRIVLAEPLLARLSQVVTSPGVLAAVRPPAPRPLPEAIGDGVFLEGVQDPGNVGSVLRSALAAGLTAVFLSAGCAAAWSPRVLRAGMGAHFRLQIYEDVDPTDLTTRARGSVVATEPEASEAIYDQDLRGPTLWLFGNEGAGLSDTCSRLAKTRLVIPMPGPAESLNLAASVAVCLFEQTRQRRAPPARRQ